MAKDLELEAVVFDLDGVVTRTARLHAAAWKELFDRFLERRAERAGEPFRPFDAETDYLTYVDGKPRYDGVRSFLASRGIELPEGDPAGGPEAETVMGLGDRKNALFNRLLEERGADVYAPAVALARALKARGAKVVIASSSKNCLAVLRASGLETLFDARVDGQASELLGLKGKPDPDIFIEGARRVEADPAKSAVVEDAVSGVRAGRNGEFGLVLGVDRGGNRVALREAGADLVVSNLAGLTVEKLDAWIRNRGHARPSALARFGEIGERLGRGRPAVFLDYDGTLTPIVARPELALIPEETRRVLGDLAAVCPTLILSGRGREDVAKMVGLDNLYFAGSHGFDIAGPSGTDVRHEVDPSLEPTIAAAAREVEGLVRDIPGALVENKRFSAAVHYRQVDESEVPRMEAAVDEVLGRHPELRKAHGKKVFEIRPGLAWDKGRALLWLLEALGLDRPEVIPLYIGDDTTDEDAFAAIRERGVAILVSDEPRETAAAYSLQDTDETREFLGLILDLARKHR